MKPVIVGMNNPHSSDPARALGTVPHNASGRRLWQMLAVEGMVKDPPIPITAEEYENTFDRWNLFDGPIGEFTTEMRHMFLNRLNDRVAVLCGTNVVRNLGLAHTGFHLRQQSAPGFVYFVIPHPSGLCREYNDVDMRVRTGRLLLALYVLLKEKA